MSGSTESPFPRSNLSLRTRAGLLVGGTMLLLLLTLMLTSSLVIGHFFVGLQDSLSGERIRRVSQVLGQLGAAKERLVRDNAQWDEAYEFLAGRNGDFLQRNYAPGVASADQDLVLAFNAQRQLVGVVQSRDDSADPYTAPAGLNLAEFAGPRLLADAAVSGLMVGDGRVLAVAACPVLPSNLSGPSNGWLVFGTWFGPGRMKEISVTAAAPIAVHPAGQRPSSEGGIVVEVDVPHLGDGRAAFPSVSL